MTASPRTHPPRQGQWPGARVLIHPECPKEAVDWPDVAGSTKELIDYALAHEEEELLFVTERGV